MSDEMHRAIASALTAADGFYKWDQRPYDDSVTVFLAALAAAGFLVVPKTAVPAATRSRR